MMKAFYNEFDPFAAKWLDNLQKAGKITPGVVDGRDFKTVTPKDVSGFERCHFFAGIGGWELALKLAGWEGPVWTASLPCQPFSVAGRGLGEKDERHLFPDFAKLVAKCLPPVIFGEQVASKDGRTWLGGVRSKMEALGYSFGAADLCAASVPVVDSQMDESTRETLEKGREAALAAGLPGLAEEIESAISLASGITSSAPHIRQRFFWVAYATSSDPKEREQQPIREFGLQQKGGHDNRIENPPQCPYNRMAHSEDAGLSGREAPSKSARRASAQYDSGNGRLANSISKRRRRWDETHPEVLVRGGSETEAERSGNSIDRRSLQWAGEWTPCSDGKARRIKPGIVPLAHGVSGRVGLIRGYGNAIVPQVAAEFISAFVEAQKDLVQSNQGETNA